MIKVTCAIIIHEHRVLITQRGADSDHPFLWEFPGGKMNQEETRENCIRREIQEELEVDIEILKSLELVFFDYGFKKIELIPFLCIISSGEIKLNNHIQYKWVLWKDLNEIEFLEADRKLIQKNRQILEEYFRK